MFWSFPVGRLAGTTVRVHVTFLLLLAWLAVDAYFRSGLAEASQTLVFVVAVFGCVTAHEFGHALVARMFGIATPDITLYPFGGVARLNTMPQLPLMRRSACCASGCFPPWRSWTRIRGCRVSSRPRR